MGIFDKFLKSNNNKIDEELESNVVTKRVAKMIEKENNKKVDVKKTEEFKELEELESLVASAGKESEELEESNAFIENKEDNKEEIEQEIKQESKAKKVSKVDNSKAKELDNIDLAKLKIKYLKTLKAAGYGNLELTKNSKKIDKLVETHGNKTGKIAEIILKEQENKINMMKEDIENFKKTFRKKLSYEEQLLKTLYDEEFKQNDIDFSLKILDNAKQLHEVDFKIAHGHQVVDELQELLIEQLYLYGYNEDACTELEREMILCRKDFNKAADYAAKLHEIVDPCIVRNCRNVNVYMHALNLLNSIVEEMNTNTKDLIRELLGCSNKKLNEVYKLIDQDVFGVIERDIALGKNMRFEDRLKVIYKHIYGDM